MSQRRYTPARLRYLGARLSILARPSFLAAIVFLSAVGLVIKEYWTNPNFLKVSENQEVSPPRSSSSSEDFLSEEDRAIAADIGNLSVLNYDQQQAKLSTNKSINNIIKKREEKLKNKLDTVKINQQKNEIKSNLKSSSTNSSLIAPRNPFLTQAENLLQLNVANNAQGFRVNNLSPFSPSLQTSQTSHSGLVNSNLGNQTSNTILENPLKSALSKLNNQSQEDTTATTSTVVNPFGRISQTDRNSSSSISSTNQNARVNQINPLVDTTNLNQPLNNQVPTANYNQQGLNNQVQNPYNNFNNNQLPTANYNQQGLNNQVQNPYNNFNNNQVPTANYNQQGLNNRVQNPYNNFNNTQIAGNRYSPQIQTRINNIYNRIINRNNPNVVNPNTLNSPINSGNTGIVQPNVQQQIPYSTQTPTQFFNNGYRY
ncbi:MAG: hypothetical protein AAF915_03190 [Cyanobacteria bacterium P01_D01_bin.50]